ncbi:hypothetical protein [Nocardioides antri]|uniref:Uncharacterized protein n=1 Tax=Nocardioides antri TaxID=2607659 RepID=A0A5B1M9Z7_9ACTN|nr:hypothetical protein [Nocardioides antri]KAA1428737.1 hypothetical protein F0U47_00500 [Nocardioides antri]
MRSTTTTRSLILGGVLAGALTLGAAQIASGDNGTTAERDTTSSSRSVQAAPDDDQRRATTVRERGIVLEGTGTWRGQPVQVFVYENNKYGNSLQIVVGDPDGKHAIGAGQGRDAYVIDGVLNVGLDVAGHLAVVKGSVTETRHSKRVTEPSPDGELIKSTGTRTRLLVDATFKYRGKTVDLRFPKAFEYDLESKRSGR